ncbi:MAG: mechanosensitive ion channel family protein [Nannocystaceae bacterium]
MLDGILHGSLLSIEALALAIAAGLVVILRLWLPVDERHELRLPVGLLIVHVVFGGIQLIFGPTGRLASFLEATATFAVMASIGRSGFLLVMDCLLGPKVVRPLPKILREILQGVIYVAVLFIALRAGGVDPTSLLTTSALLTAIIGLSLQDTLGNLFAGLAIQAEHPFEVGDWIQFDDDEKHVGRVLEINWRATKLVTLENVLVVVPNGALAKTPLANFNKPTRPAMRSVEVIAPYEVPPQRVHNLLLEALRGLPGVLDEPAPSVLTRAFHERGITYWLRYFIRDFEGRLVIESHVRNRVWYALQRAEIAIPAVRRDVRVYEQSASEEKRHALAEMESHRDALARLDFLAPLPTELLDHLAELVHTRLYTAGEFVFRQGEAGDELYIIQSGEVAISFDTSAGTSVELTRLGPGKFFGEMSMLTDSRRHANVRATMESELLVVGKAALGQILERSPALADTIRKALGDRQEMLQSLTAEVEALPSDSVKAPQGVFLGRIRDFFSLS